MCYEHRVPATVEDTLALLRQVPLFEQLTEDDIVHIADVAVPRSYEAREVVFREGDESDTLFIVRTGRARAVREHPHGRAITLATFGPGDIFGELAVLDGERRSATIEAVDPTEATAIVGHDVRRLLRERPAIAAAMLGALASRLRETTERLARQSFQTVQSRVAGVLVDLTEGELGASPAGGVVIASTQAHVAQLAGTSRESASRFLAVLERAGIITQGRGRLVVHDPAALERYVY